MATKARQLAKQPPTKVFKDEWKERRQTLPEQETHTRAHIMRNINRTQHIQDKTHEPAINRMKWKCAEVLKIGSTNIRGMRDPVKREKKSVYKWKGII